jgi:hypothetical protein
LWHAAKERKRRQGFGAGWEEKTRTAATIIITTIALEGPEALQQGLRLQSISCCLKVFVAF